MSHSKIAVLKTSTEKVFQDIEKLCELAEIKNHLVPSRTVILKDNLSWHFPFLGANTTPWKLEGIIRTLKTHIYTTTTGAMKNAFGGLLNTKRHTPTAFYHDYLWWPFIGTRMMKKLQKKSQWGRYFKNYPSLP